MVLLIFCIFSFSLCSDLSMWIPFLCFCFPRCSFLLSWLSSPASYYPSTLCRLVCVPSVSLCWFVSLFPLRSFTSLSRPVWIFVFHLLFHFCLPSLCLCVSYSINLRTCDAPTGPSRWPPLPELRSAGGFILLKVQKNSLFFRPSSVNPRDGCTGKPACLIPLKVT